MSAATPNEPMAWVPTKEILHRTGLFLDAFKFAKADLEVKQLAVDDMVPGMWRGHHRSRIWRMEREVSVIRRLAEASIDGRILLSASDLDLVHRATPLAVEDALRDLEKDAAHRRSLKAQSNVDQIIEDTRAEVRARYRRAKLMTFAGVVLLVAAVAIALSKGIIQ